MQKRKNTAASRLAGFIENAVSPYHTVGEGKKLLKKAGFEELPARGSWKLEKGGKYMVSPFKTVLFAFTVPDEAAAKSGRKASGSGFERGLHIAAAHTDFPCLHLKPEAVYENNGYLRVNTEIYGGPILNTWLDRPLSLAGRIFLRSSDIYAPEELIADIARPVLTIPNLAVHYNREVNDGVKLSKQNDMLPLMGMTGDPWNRNFDFTDFLAKETGVEQDRILDFDLFVYNAEKPEFVGCNEEMLSSPRLDNITSCLALIEGIAGAEDNGGINVAALFDNEEVGSTTKQGADSALLDMILKKIYRGLGMKEESLDDDIFRGFLLSVDVAHALHPAHAEKFDQLNSMLLNDGITLKLSANQRYTYDGVAVAVIQQLCESAGVHYRKFVNHSDMPGGTTLGPIISSHLPMYTVDIGVPILAMHSARELMGCSDQDELVKLMKAFF